MIHCFVGMQEANPGVCSSSSWYTEESPCGCNTTPYFTPLWVCWGVEVFLAFLGKGVPYVCVYILVSHSNTDIVFDSSSLLCGDAGSLNTAW